MNDDILIRIFSYLSLKNKLSCMQVCKSWYNLGKYIFHDEILDIDIEEYVTNIDWIKKYTPILYINNNEEKDMVLNCNTSIAKNIYNLQFVLVHTIKTSYSFYCDKKLVKNG